MYQQPYVYFLAARDRGEGKVPGKHIVRFKLTDLNGQPEEALNTRGFVADFCVAEDHTVSYISIHNEGYFFGQIIPGTGSKDEVLNRVNLGKQWPDIQFLTTVIQFGQYFVCSGITKNKDCNLIVLLGKKADGTMDVLSHVSINTLWSRICLILQSHPSRIFSESSMKTSLS